MAKEKTKNNVWQAAKFTLFEASAGIIQELSFLLMYNVFNWQIHESWGYTVSYVVSLVLSVLWSFTFNRRYTFRSNANIVRSMLLVALYYVIFTPLSTWWGNALTGIGWNGNLVQILTMLINFVTEFIYQRCFVYRGTIDTNSVAQKSKQKKK